MKRLDVYYRALLEYREQTQRNRECVSDSGAVVKANPDLDKIVLTRKHCIIEQDWVDAIEEGLKYIAKAIAEERQFIHSNGETVPIEKVKNVSKDSVVHLAKHSNLITREIPGQDVIPDQLYTVEKLSDYTVYENKFLYLLLCYLRDFITIRYNKILELSNTYNGTMTMNKVVKTAGRTIKYSVDLAEESRDDEYLKETNRAKDIINRIDLLLKTVLAFFSTPLMQIVSKAPMIKPPITKTNVLKMNNNFKQALNLYGYVVAYEGDGYRVETEVREFSPFNDAIAEEMAETILLSSFITYEHSLGIEENLRREYLLEEQRRKERALVEFKEKIEAARARVAKSEMSMEEYILILEKYIRELEKKAKELDKLKGELEETKAMLEQTTKENEELRDNLERTINELEAEKQRYVTDMVALKLAHEEQIRSLVAEYEHKIAQIEEKHANEMNELREEHERAIAELKEEHDEEIAALEEKHEQTVAEMREDHAAELVRLGEGYEKTISQKDTKIAALTEQSAQDKAAHEEQMLRMSTEYSDNLSALSTKNTELSAQLDTEVRERRFIKAQYLALKRETGRLTEEDDHVTQITFDELQRTYEQFKKFFGEEWQKAKKQIRRDAFKILRRKKKIVVDEDDILDDIPEKGKEEVPVAKKADESATPDAPTPVEASEQEERSEVQGETAGETVGFNVTNNEKQEAKESVDTQESLVEDYQQSSDNYSISGE